MSDQSVSVSKQAIFQAIVGEASGFYNLILTVASSFLGGSLLFIEKIAPRPSACSLTVLGMGWLLLVGSIVAVAWVRLQNLESGRMALEDEYEAARAIDHSTRWWSRLAAFSLAFGILFVMMFGMVNIVQTKQLTDREGVMAENTKNGGGSVEKKSIPFGSTEPSQPSQGGQQQNPGGSSGSVGGSQGTQIGGSGKPK